MDECSRWLKNDNARLKMERNRFEAEKRARLAARDKEYEDWMRANCVSYKRYRTRNGSTVYIRGQDCISPKVNIHTD